MKYLSDNGQPNVTYGRVAKLVAVYLKSMAVVGPGANSSLSAVAHPPIDSILLKNLASDETVVSPYKAHWKSLAWTKLNEAEYYTLVSELRSVLRDSDPWWTLEKYWNASRR